ncbi:MAG: excinuclease ABC subunit C [Parcubacteria group bacterium]|nr:excinuclease ABC subunit C [Parcubacteria group bacterium]|tara:strand:+ start:197 stop:469 length:273 start_codon:yes stop_codon:yes gene_type:complete
MFYNYVIQSLKNNKFIYKGSTTDLKKRFSQHNKGQVKSTRKNKPYKLIYYEACLNKDDAYRRERTLKSGPGRKWTKQRLKEYFKNQNKKI